MRSGSATHTFPVSLLSLLRSPLRQSLSLLPLSNLPSHPLPPPQKSTPFSRSHGRCRPVLVHRIRLTVCLTLASCLLTRTCVLFIFYSPFNNLIPLPPDPRPLSPNQLHARQSSSPRYIGYGAGIIRRIRLFYSHSVEYEGL